MVYNSRMSDQPEYPTTPDYQQPQYPQPQYPQYPPAPPKKGGTGKWIALGGCGCLFFLAVIAGVVFLVFQMTKAPMQAVNDHLAALRNHDLEKAYNNCSSGFKKETSLAGFKSYVEGYPFFNTSTEFSSSDRKTENGITTLDGNVESTDGSKHPVEYKVIKESGAYRVHYIHVNEAATPPPEEVEGTQNQGGSEPEIFDIKLDKSQQGNVVTVKIAFQVKEFNNRHSGGTFSIHLVQDLETLGPDGIKLDNLSADAIKTLTDSGEMQYTSANFTNTLTIPTTYPQGTYTVNLRVHDQIGGGMAEQTTTFEFP